MTIEEVIAKLKFQGASGASKLDLPDTLPAAGDARRQYLISARQAYENPALRQEIEHALKTVLEGMYNASSTEELIGLRMGTKIFLALFDRLNALSELEQEEREARDYARKNPGEDNSLDDDF